MADAADLPDDALAEALRRPWSDGSNAAGGELSDDAIALAFSARHGDDLLHVAAWGHWLRWDGARWARDTTLAVFDLARLICRQHAADARDGTRVASAQKVAAVVSLARSDRRHAREGAAFDAAPWLLNTPGGVVDLRTGMTRAHRRGDLLTKVTGTAPAGDCPRWRAFLEEVTQGDTETVAYLQRWAGYMLSRIDQVQRSLDQAWASQQRFAPTPAGPERRGRPNRRPVAGRPDRVSRRRATSGSGRSTRLMARCRWMRRSAFWRRC